MRGKGAAGDHYISIVRISPFGLPDPGRRYIVIKAYYDGSNKSHEAGYLILCGVATPEGILPSFERRWAEILRARGLRWWHTTDALAGTKRDFLIDPCAPWDRSVAEAAMAELHTFIGDFSVQHWQRGFQLFSCSVHLESYRRALAADPLLRSAEAICVDWCVGALKLDDDGAALLYFDRHESFMKEVEQVWRKDSTKRHLEWPRQIKAISPVDSREVLPVQAADLLAWQVGFNVRHATEKGAPFCDLWGQTHAYYELEEIKRRYPPETERARVEAIRRAGRNTRETRALRALEQRERAAG